MAARPGHIDSVAFGALPDGRMVERVTLSHGGVEAAILNWGATIQAVRVPGRDGAVADVAAGYGRIADYLAHGGYLGATIGRVANRIAGARFTLDGVRYTLPANNGPNCLHGGAVGFDRQLWAIEGLGVDADGPWLALSLTSADGDQGFPGTVRITAQWRLSGDGVLSVDYRAVSDAATIINITSHAYWNLAGESAPGDALSHDLMIAGDAYLPIDAHSIPTGEWRAVAGTHFDFRGGRTIAAQMIAEDDAQIRIAGGFDHSWVTARAPRTEAAEVARLYDGVSGRRMRLYSNQPGLQFYAGNHFDGSARGKGGKRYTAGSIIALEPQMFPDTPNQPALGSIRLDAGAAYHHRIAWAFDVASNIGI